MLQDKYDEKADIFSIGSTLFTMAFGSLLFDKRSKGDAMAMSRELVDYGRFGLRVQDIMTSRHKRMRNYANPRLMDLLEGLLQADPSRRLSAEDALKHPFFS
jgi:serine/threonine protein kinase